MPGDAPQRLDPAPCPTLADESGPTVCWLASDFTPDDIRDEWGHERDALREQWWRFRWTTPEELSDEDALHDLFGDWEWYGIDTSVVCERTNPGSPGAHRYWTVDR